MDNSKFITNTNKWRRRKNYPTVEFPLGSGEEMMETEVNLGSENYS